jgi:hypothetical protein
MARPAVVLAESFVEGRVGRRRHDFADDTAPVDTRAAQIHPTRGVDDTAEVGSDDVRDGAEGGSGGDLGDKAGGCVFLRYVVCLFEAGHLAAFLLWDDFFLRVFWGGDEDVWGAAEPFNGWGAYCVRRRWRW